MALITPLLKKSTADREILSNYRPMSNLPFISKCCEKVVALRLNQHLHDNRLHEVFQSVYKPCHSTESALIRVQNDILTDIDNDNCVMLLFLDLSAAFDTMNHQVLLSRLSDRFGIKGSALSWFEFYLQGRTQFVCINNSWTVSVPVVHCSTWRYTTRVWCTFSHVRRRHPVVHVI